MRILFVSPFFAPIIGGVESVLENVCIALAARGHSVKVLTSALTGAPREEQRDGYEIVRSEMLSVPDTGIISAGRFDYWAIRSMFKRVIEEHDPSVIHFQNYQMRSYSMFLNCFLHCLDPAKFVTLDTIHNDSDDAFSQYILSYYPLDRVVTPTSRASIDLIEGGVPANRLAMIPNTIDVSQFTNAHGGIIRQTLGIGEDTQLILFPSRLVGREGNFFFDSTSGKGLDILIRAIPEILESVPKAKLMLLGNDPIFPDRTHDLRVRLEGIVDTFAKGSLLFLEQPIPNSYLPQIYAASDVVVSLSSREAFGMVFLEAMAAGKPVVAVNTLKGGVPEVVPDEVAGYLVPENDPHSTARAICKILRDDDISKDLQKNGLKWVKKKFDIHVVIPQLVNTYRSVILEKGLESEDELKVSISKPTI